MHALYIYTPDLWFYKINKAKMHFKNKSWTKYTLRDYINGVKSFQNYRFKQIPERKMLQNFAL